MKDNIQLQTMLFISSNSIHCEITYFP